LVAVVNLLPHSLRGFLSKKGIKTTADAELTEQLSQDGVAAKAFLTLNAVKRVISIRFSPEVAERLVHFVGDALEVGDESLMDVDEDILVKDDPVPLLPSPLMLQGAAMPRPQPLTLALPNDEVSAGDKGFSLKHQDQGAELMEQLERYRAYWLNSHVPNRKGNKLSAATVEKRVE
jgi:hypothetical protein